MNEFSSKALEKLFMDLNHSLTFGDVSLMESCLERGFPINAHYWNGTALYHAASKGRLELCKYLLSKGADSEIHGSDSAPTMFVRTPYQVAYEKGYTSICVLIRAHQRQRIKDMKAEWIKAREDLEDLELRETHSPRGHRVEEASKFLP
jgi:hypothetical protein